MVSTPNQQKDCGLKLIATLSYFNEEPALLRECISRLSAVGVDVVVAVDGPYDLYPTRLLGSSFETSEAIVNSCSGAGQPDLVLRNKSGWEGNEVEKRNYMLEVALSIAEEGDWLLVVDSDHMWEPNRLYDLKQHLEGFAYNVVEVAFADCSLEDPMPNWYEARLLLRAIPGMHYEGAHWRVRFPDGTAVSTLKGGDHLIDRPAEIIKFHDFRVRHTVYQAGEERRGRQGAYYQSRDAGEGIEH